MDPSFLDHLTAELDVLKEQGLYKAERIITTQQAAEIAVSTGEEVLNFCANNYLGLANDPRLIEAARAALTKHGFGMSSVRFICGTLDAAHRELERAISRVPRHRRHDPVRRPASTPTAACSRRCSDRTTRS